MDSFSLPRMCEIDRKKALLRSSSEIYSLFFSFRRWTICIFDPWSKRVTFVQNAYTQKLTHAELARLIIKKLFNRSWREYVAWASCRGHNPHTWGTVQSTSTTTVLPAPSLIKINITKSCLTAKELDKSNEKAKACWLDKARASR